MGGVSLLPSWELNYGKEFVRCAGAESRAAGEWNEKAFKWHSKCLWEMEKETLPWWEGTRGRRSLGLSAQAPQSLSKHNRALLERGLIPLQ